jgi:DNA primase small subunit
MIRKRDLVLVENYFREYYFKNSDKIINSIKDLESREFAYIDFEGVMRRHISLKENEFKNWLMENVPRDFYHSTAYYLFPSKNMEAKSWEGADLVFDIDLDHIRNYQTKKVVVCVDNGKVKILENNEECSGDRREIMLLEEEGFEIAKRELLMLIEILVRDFDIKEEDINIYFSGGRGYHVHVLKEEYQKLDSYARMEIKDYLTYDGIDIRNIKDVDARPFSSFVNALLRLDNELKEVFTEKEIEVMRSKLEESRDRLLRFLRRNKVLASKSNLFITKYLGVQIDGVVTVDVSRLIRVPYSLHGKTGLVKKKIKYEELDQFNPLANAVREEEKKVRLKILYCPEIYWYDGEYGPYREEEAVVPFSLAIYLVMRGLGHGIREY